MNNIYFILLSSIFFFSGCKDRINIPQQPFPFVDSTKPFKKEIPIFQDGDTTIFYEVAKEKQRQLGLDSLENGFANLQIRIWYDFSLVTQRKLVIISNTQENWSAKVYDLKVDYDGIKETILTKYSYYKTPNSGWANFSKKLLDLKILTLPDHFDIPGYANSRATDGNTYNVEVATKNQYRYYGYWEPDLYKNKYWEAKNMAAILELLHQELGVCQLPQYFGGCN